MNTNGHRTGEPGHAPGLVGSRARQSTSPFPLCFAQKQAVGIIIDLINSEMLTKLVDE